MIDKYEAAPASGGEISAAAAVTAIASRL